MPLKEAARKIAFAEDRAVFDGYAAAGIGGIHVRGEQRRPVLPPDRGGAIQASSRRPSIDCASPA